MGTIENLCLLAAAVVKGLNADDPERAEWEHWAAERAPYMAHSLKGRTLGNMLDEETGSLSIEVERRRARKRRR